MLTDVSLEARLATEEGRLRADLLVRNGGDRDVYLLDVAFRVGRDGLEVRGDHLTVAFTPPDTLVLSSKLRPIPPGMTFATPPVFYATRLPAGGTLTRTLGAPMPLRTEGWRPPVTGPQGALVGPPSREERCAKARVELGAILHADDLVTKPVVLAGREVVEFGAAALARQSVLSAEVRGLSLTVTVVERS